MGGSGTGSSYREVEMTEKKSDLVRAKISRRKFIATAAAAGIATPLAVACAPAPVAAPVAPVQVEVTRIVEMEGKTVVEQVMVTPTALPAKVDLVTANFDDNPPPILTTSGNFASFVYSKLITMDPGFSEILPDLAESWEQSADGVSVVFKLRQGVTWHDGEPLTADDVIFTYTTLADPAVSGWQVSRLSNILGFQEYKAGTSKDISGLVKVDDLTVKIVQAVASPMLLENLAMIWIYPYHLLKDVPGDKMLGASYWQDSLVGTGVFKFKEWKREESFTLTANENYWRGAPILQSYTGRNIKDPNVGIISLMKGEIDMMSVNSPDDIAKIQSVNYLAASYSPNTTQNGLTMGSKVFTNDLIRRGIAHAINREEVADKIYKGTAKVNKVAFNAAWVSTDGVDMHDFDPDKAKALIKESGWDVKKEIQIVTYYTDAFNGRVLAAFQQYLVDVGLNATVLQSEWAAIEKGWNEGTLPIAFGGYPQGPDPSATKDNFYSRGNDYAKYSDPVVDDLYDAGDAEFDQAKRGKIYNELHKALNDHCWVIPLWQPPRYKAYSKKLIGVEGNTAAGNLTFYGQVEKWHFDA